MADLPARLEQFFAAPQTRMLASLAPLGLVAAASSTIIGAALATPAFAASGLGLVLTSVAANVTSSLLYDLVRPGLEEGQRERTIAQGLKNHDPGVIRLVAEALAGGGPEVARAIPEQIRAELIDALRQGMQEPGGALAAIAPGFTAGLSTPQTDWSALQAQLRQAIDRASQTIETAEGGVISGGRQQVEGARGPVEQVMRASGQGSRIENSSQVVTGASAARDASPPAGAPLGQREHSAQLLAQHQRRLQKLEQRAAAEGLHAPPQVLIEIDDLRAEIARLQPLARVESDLTD